MRYTRDMTIGIDISQIVFTGTGVSRYIEQMTEAMIKFAPSNTYILFGATLRQQKKIQEFSEKLQKISKNVRLVYAPIPPTILDILWNTLHIIPITWFTGPIDVFWSSDWTQPPIPKKTIGITTIHDVSFLIYPESFPEIIKIVQERRLNYAKRECSLFLCDSESTKKDVIEKLHIPKDKCVVIYPGYNR
ncbi:MAG: glycosyl transferase, group 1 [uncultured bacterium]|nr:MAG: glycosyl transferase, group 1 [uncultured bacterium]